MDTSFLQARRRGDSFGANLFRWLFSLFVVFILYQGWNRREELIWTPEHGAGYALGITGGVMMLLLLLYPLSKRSRLMTRRLSVKRWFQIHMLFGIIGPVLVVLHSNFSLGSINGRMAIFSMLTVSVSGLVGRYIYQKIHYGLYGTKIRFEELRSESGLLMKELDAVFASSLGHRDRLSDFESSVLSVPEGVFESFLFWVKMRLRAWFLYRSIKNDVRRSIGRVPSLAEEDQMLADKQSKRVLDLIALHKKSSIRLLELNFWERLFATWHLLHLPLFIMMIVTAIFHVYAVHVY